MEAAESLGRAENVSPVVGNPLYNGTDPEACCSLQIAIHLRSKKLLSIREIHSDGYRVCHI